ncbi:MAG TPA: Maf family protein [Vicinamibacterales bacterium]|jgi:septum formation protein|nr:Maf family protein [Vicinamibacterales bacterium]
MRLVLASASPRRADLLRTAGFRFETRAVDVDERVLDGEAPEACVQRLASAKSAAAEPRADASDVLVLGADTVVVAERAILGKPKDDEDAARMLGRLAGRHHEVATGVSLRLGGRELTAVELTTVFFTRMSTAEIAWYVQTGEGRDKAGAYAIQGLGARFVERIAGSYSNVVGLPVSVVYRLIRELASATDSELF